MCILIRIKSGVNSGQQALEKIQFEGTIAQKLKAISRVPSVRLLRNNSPHTGQSSQLPLDANDRIAQFLPTIAENVVGIDKQSLAIQQN